MLNYFNTGLKEQKLLFSFKYNRISKQQLTLLAYIHAVLNLFTHNQVLWGWGREYLLSSSGKAWRTQNTSTISIYPEKKLQINQQHRLLVEERLNEFRASWDVSFGWSQKRTCKEKVLFIPSKTICICIRFLYLHNEPVWLCYPDSLPWRWNTGQWCRHHTLPHGAAPGLCRNWGNPLPFLKQCRNPPPQKKTC